MKAVNNIEISLIICTRNRAEGLKRTLESVSRLRSRHSWELVVVDNGSTDHTRDVIKQYTAVAEHQVVSDFEAEPGLSCARNAGILASQGQLIAFTDDDCYPDEHYLTNICTTFLEKPVDYLGGRVLLYDEGDLPTTIRTQDTAEEFPPGHWFSSGAILGANMAFRRQCLEAVGGFDESLGAGSFFRAGDDTDLVRRLSWEGCHGKYEPAVLVYHHHGRQSPQQARQLKINYSWGRGAGFAKCFLYQSYSIPVLKRWYYNLRPCTFDQIWRELFSGALFLLYKRFSRLAARNHKGAERFEKVSHPQETEL